MSVHERKNTTPQRVNVKQKVDRSDKDAESFQRVGYLRVHLRVAGCSSCRGHRHSSLPTNRANREECRSAIKKGSIAGLRKAHLCCYDSFQRVGYLRVHLRVAGSTSGRGLRPSSRANQQRKQGRMTLSFSFSFFLSAMLKKI